MNEWEWIAGIFAGVGGLVAGLVGGSRMGRTEDRSAVRGGVNGLTPAKILAALEQIKQESREIRKDLGENQREVLAILRSQVQISERQTEILVRLEERSR